MKPFDFDLFNTLGAYNEAFDMRQVIRQHPEKWFHYRYENMYEYTYRVYRDGFLTGIDFSHVCTPMRKSSMEACYHRFTELIDNTCRHRFRNNNGVNRQIYHVWEMMNGSFEHVTNTYFGRFINLSLKRMDYVRDLFNDSSLICLYTNDHEGISDDFLIIKEKTIALFEQKLSEKSKFEL